MSSIFTGLDTRHEAPDALEHLLGTYTDLDPSNGKRLLDPLLFDFEEDMDPKSTTSTWTAGVLDGTSEKIDDLSSQLRPPSLTQVSFEIIHTSSMAIPAPQFAELELDFKEHLGIESSRGQELVSDVKSEEGVAEDAPGSEHYDSDFEAPFSDVLSAWSPKEDARCIQLCKEHKSRIEVTRLLNKEFRNRRTVSSVKQRIARLRKWSVIESGKKAPPYSGEELQILKQLASTKMSPKEIAEYMNKRFGTTRPSGSIKTKLSSMRRSKELPPTKDRYAYTEEEKTLLVRLSHEGMSKGRIAERLSEVSGVKRGVTSVRKHLSLLRNAGVDVPSKTQHRYSRDEVALMVEMYQKDLRVVDIVHQLSIQFQAKRSYRSVWNKIKLLKEEGVISERVPVERKRRKGPEREARAKRAKL